MRSHTQLRMILADYGNARTLKAGQYVAVPLKPLKRAFTGRGNNSWCALANGYNANER